METDNLILLEKCCSKLEIEYSFIKNLNENGLIEIILIENEQYISNEHLKRLERAIQFHYGLNINVEGIDVIHNLLTQIDDLQEELRIAKNKLNLLELD
jgi:hypothetical protein